MKVLTRNVVIENQEYVLISDKSNGKTWFGTIPYAELDSNGRMKRELNGLQMRISFESAADALMIRHADILTDKLLPELEKEYDHDIALCKAIHKAYEIVKPLYSNK